jgi:hypothetical protein
MLYIINNLHKLLINLTHITSLVSNDCPGFAERHQLSKQATTCRPLTNSGRLRSLGERDLEPLQVMPSDSRHALLQLRLC